MHKELESGAVDLLSAALRHVRDAEHLATDGGACHSPNQAVHLAGYGPECARKATLHYRSFDKAIGHELGEGMALDIALCLDPWAHRYEPLHWKSRYPKLAAWTPECRYEPTDPQTDTRPIVEEARQIVDAITAALWADGRLPGSFLARGGR